MKENREFLPKFKATVIDLIDKVFAENTSEFQSISSKLDLVSFAAEFSLLIHFIKYHFQSAFATEASWNQSFHWSLLNKIGSDTDANRPKFKLEDQHTFFRKFADKMVTRFSDLMNATCLTMIDKKNSEPG